MSASVSIASGGNPKQLYDAVTLRLARERVTETRPLRDVLRVVHPRPPVGSRVDRGSDAHVALETR